MTRSPKGLSAVLAGAALIMGTLAAAAPASAATARPMRPASSWLGTCYPWNDNETAGGWCNGNGPNWTYEGRAVCNVAGFQYDEFGPSRWAGDRRGSYGYCSTDGGVLVSGYLSLFYNGVFQFSLSA
jgi:hypothetical protein